MGSFLLDRRVARGLLLFRMAQRGPRWYGELGKVALFWLLLAAVVLLPMVMLYLAAWVCPGLRVLAILWMVLLLMLPALALVRGFVFRKRAGIVLNYLRQGLSLNSPLPEWLAIAAHGERGVLAARLAVLAEVLRGGTPLATALRYGLPELAPADQALIAQAEAGGSLPESLARLELRRQRWRAGDDLDRVYLLFIAGGLVVAWIAFGGAEVFVFAKMIKLSSSFHAAIPPMALALIRSRNWVGPAGFFLAILLLFLTAIWLRQFLWPDYRRLRFIEWLRQRLLYYTPLVGHIYRPGQWASATNSLARGVADGRTLPDVLQTAQSSGVEGVAGAKLSRWQRLLAGGMALRPAAEAANLPRLLCAALVPGGAQILADGLNYVAAVYAQRYRRRLEIFRSAIIPAAVVSFGLVVGLLVVSLWQMYVAIIILVEHQGPY